MSPQEALLLRWAEVAWGMALAVALLAGVQALRAAWAILRAGGFADRATLLAVAVGGLLRLGGGTDMANWYADLVLPGEAVRTARYGPAWPVLQGAARDLGLDAGALTALAGWIAVPLTARLAVQLGLGRRVGTWSAWALAVMPLHVHLSGSTAEHMVAATLLLGATVAWLEAVHDPTQWVGFLASVVLCHTAALVRIDAWPLALAVPLAMVVLPAPVPLRSALVPVSVFGAAWAIQGLALHEWVALPSHVPLPTLDERLHALRITLADWELVTWPSPYRLPVHALIVVVGAVTLAVRRWPLAAWVGIVALLPAVALARMPHDEVNLRYFAAGLPWLALVVGSGTAAVARTVWHKRVGPPLVVAAVTVAGAFDLYGALVVRPQLAFRDEARWLTNWLHFYGKGCTVHHVSPLGWQVPRDLDCCLDAPRSTAAQVPGVTFADRRPQADPPPHDWSRLGPPPLPEIGPGCHLWYEGAICQLTPDPKLRAKMGRGLDAIAAHCQLWRQRTVGAPNEHVQAYVSRRSIDPWFGDDDGAGVPIRLWRVR